MGRSKKITAFLVEEKMDRGFPYLELVSTATGGGFDDSSDSDDRSY